MKPKTLIPLALVLACAAALSPVRAQQPAAPAAQPQPEQTDFKTLAGPIELNDGDTLVFLGDSITHQCLYTQFVEDFFYTRYPQKRIHFHNAGVGGDRGSDALRRFDEDVAVYKPKYVTILLGMNDGSYTNYQQPIFDTYQRDMTTILDKIAALGATAVPMTPTIFDARAKRMGKAPAEPRDTYYNGVLALYGAWLREVAEVRGLGFVNMWGPLNDITDEQRKKDAKFTLAKDGVHPGADGQTVMAVAVLNDMVPKSPVSQIVVQESKDPKQALTVANGKGSDLQVQPEKISFTVTENALPWVLPPDAALGYKLTHAGHKLSNQKITFRGLPAGKYELKIDGTAVGQWTSGQLGFGVELEENDKTPQYQQALKVALLNKKRNDEAMHPLRDSYGQLKGKRRDLDKATQANDPQLETKKADFEKWCAEHKTRVTDLTAKAKAIEDEIYKANQPVPHQYELTPVKEDAAAKPAAAK